MYKTVVFDVDGTLIDGTEGILASVKYMIEKHHLKQLSEEVLKTFIGPPVQNSLKQIYSMTEEEAQICANTFREKYSKEDVYKAKVYDGICEILCYLKSKKYKLGVATYKREDYAISLMQHFGLDKYFDSVCGADNENKLSKMDILKNCINNLSHNNSEVIMIGDSYHDADAAENLGIKFIGVTYGFGFKNEYELKKYDKNLLFVATTPLKLKEFYETL